MKHLVQILALGLLLVSISLPIFANANTYPVFTGKLEEVSYRTIAECVDFILVEINGEVYRVEVKK